MKQSSNIQKLQGVTAIEMIITMILISTIALIGTQLIMNYNEQFEWGQAVSGVSFSAINALDVIESELMQASASSIVLSNQPPGSTGYQTIDFPKVTGYNISTKTPTIDVANTIRFTLENNTLNKYIINKTTNPETVVSGPTYIAGYVTNFLVNVVSEYVYNISITVQKTYSDGQTLSSTYSRQVYIRNR